MLLHAHKVAMSCGRAVGSFVCVECLAVLSEHWRIEHHEIKPGEMPALCPVCKVTINNDASKITMDGDMCAAIINRYK